MLVLHIFFTFLAGFGLFCAIWALAGFFLPPCKEGWLYCSNLSFVPVYLWLRGMGIVNCPLRILNQGFSEAEKKWLTFKEIEVWEREPT